MINLYLLNKLIKSQQISHYNIIAHQKYHVENNNCFINNGKMDLL